MADKTIAVIDDDPDQRDLITEILEGYPIQCFPSAADFFANYQQSEGPDLLLCDIQMDGMNGYQVCRQIRQHSTFGKVPIILISGLVDQINFMEAVEAGANEYISKPLHVLELKDLIEKQLSLAQTR